MNKLTFYNLNLLTSPLPFKNYENISISKHKYKKILYGSEIKKSRTYNIIKKCYVDYETNKEQLEKVTPYDNFSKKTKEALLHCYTGNTKLIRNLKQAIIDNQNVFYRGTCAYCGLNETKYMDHYLPKDDFPEFSILSYNLVPCCSYCNEKKSKNFLDNTGERKIFNPYFEKAEETPIINCKLVCLESILKFSIELRDNVSNKVFLNHLVTLGLIKRYEEQLPRIIASIIFDLIVNFDETNISIKKAKKVMDRKLKETESIQGNNSLLALVYRAFLEQDQLFDVDYLRKIYFKLRTSKKSRSTVAS